MIDAGNGIGFGKEASVAARAEGNGKKPNILVIFGDDIGQSNISVSTHGLMGDRTPTAGRPR